MDNLSLRVFYNDIIHTLGVFISRIIRNFDSLSGNVAALVGPYIFPPGAKLEATFRL